MRTSLDSNGIAEWCCNFENFHSSTYLNIRNYGYEDCFSFIFALMIKFTSELLHNAVLYTRVIIVPPKINVNFSITKTHRLREILTKKPNT